MDSFDIFSTKVDRKDKYNRVLEWINGVSRMNSMCESDKATENYADRCIVSDCTQSKQINSEHFRSVETGSWILATNRHDAYDAEKRQCRSCGILLGTTSSTSTTSSISKTTSLWKSHWYEHHVDKLKISMHYCGYGVSETHRLTMHRRPPEVTDCGRHIVPGAFECCCGERYALSTPFIEHAKQCEDAMSFSRRQTICELGLEPSEASSDLPCYASASSNSHDGSKSQAPTVSLSLSSPWSLAKSLSPAEPESADEGSGSLGNSGDGDGDRHPAAKRFKPNDISTPCLRPRPWSAMASLKKSLDMMRRRAANKQRPKTSLSDSHM